MSPPILVGAGLVEQNAVKAAVWNAIVLALVVCAAAPAALAQAVPADPYSVAAQMDNFGNCRFYAALAGDDEKHFLKTGARGDLDNAATALVMAWHYAKANGNLPGGCSAVTLRTELSAFYGRNTAVLAVPADAVESVVAEAERTFVANTANGIELLTWLRYDFVNELPTARDEPGVQRIRTAIAYLQQAYLVGSGRIVQRGPDGARRVFDADAYQIIEHGMGNYGIRRSADGKDVIPLQAFEAFSDAAPFDAAPGFVPGLLYVTEL